LCNVLEIQRQVYKSLGAESLHEAHKTEMHGQVKNSNRTMKGQHIPRGRIMHRMETCTPGIWRSPLQNFHKVSIT
jgi:hypothetical protein